MEAESHDKFSSTGSFGGSFGGFECFGVMTWSSISEFFRKFRGFFRETDSWSKRGKDGGSLDRIGKEVDFDSFEGLSFSLGESNL